MERVPAYLVWYLLRIRRHADDPEFLPERFERLDIRRVELEVDMLKRLAALGCIGLDERTERKSAEPSSDSVALRYGEPLVIDYPLSFALHARGHYLLRESVAQGLGHVCWTVLAAVLGGVVALWLSQVFHGQA